MVDKIIIKINIGCGPHSRADWINLDWGILPFLSRLPRLIKLLIKVHLLPKNYSYPWLNTPRLYDCRKRLPFLDTSVDFIYTSHFLEHLPRYQTIMLLKECRRILRRGGILRVSVPDLKLVAEKYVKNDINFFINLVKSDNPGLNNITDLFVIHFYGFDIWSKPDFLRRVRNSFIRGHLWMYDYDSLKEILESVGFTNIKRCNPGSGEVPDIEFLDIHRENSLYIEAYF